MATPVIDRLEGLSSEEFSEVVLRAAAAGEDALSVWKLLAIEGARRLVRPTTSAHPATPISDRAQGH